MLVLIADAPDVEEMLAALGESAWQIARRTLTIDQVAELESSLGATQPASPER